YSATRLLGYSACEPSGRAAERHLAQRHCHPARSEGSTFILKRLNRNNRSFVAALLRMTTMTIFSFEGIAPVVHESAFVHPNATVTGDVIIGRDVYVGPGAAIRGDWGKVVIEDGCNVQENCVIHMFPGAMVVLEASAHVGHGAIVHGARIGRNALIGMNAVIMDNAVIGAECVVGALTFVPADMQIPARKVVVGSPPNIV